MKWSPQARVARKTITASTRAAGAMSHPDFHDTTLKITIMIKCGLTKTFECFGTCLDWFLSVVASALKIK